MRVVAALLMAVIVRPTLRLALRDTLYVCCVEDAGVPLQGCGQNALLGPRERQGCDCLIVSGRGVTVLSYNFKRVRTVFGYFVCTFTGLAWCSRLAVC